MAEMQTCSKLVSELSMMSPSFRPEKAAQYRCESYQSLGSGYRDPFRREMLGKESSGFGSTVRYSDGQNEGSLTFEPSAMFGMKSSMERGKETHEILMLESISKGSKDKETKEGKTDGKFKREEPINEQEELESEKFGESGVRESKSASLKPENKDKNRFNMLITSAERFCPENVDKGGNEETNEFLKVSDVPKTIDTDSSKMHGTLGGGFINLESEKMVKLEDRIDEAVPKKNIKTMMPKVTSMTVLPLPLDPLAMTKQQPMKEIKEMKQRSKSKPLESLTPAKLTPKIFKPVFNPQPFYPTPLHPQHLSPQPFNPREKNYNISHKSISISHKSISPFPINLNSPKGKEVKDPQCKNYNDYMVSGDSLSQLISRYLRNARTLETSMKEQLRIIREMIIDSQIDEVKRSIVELENDNKMTAMKMRSSSLQKSLQTNKMSFFKPHDIRLEEHVLEQRIEATNELYSKQQFNEMLIDKCLARLKEQPELIMSLHSQVGGLLKGDAVLESQDEGMVVQSRVTRVEGRRRGDDEDSNEFLTEGTEIDKLNRLANSQFSDSTNFRSNFHAFPGNNIFKTKGGRYQELLRKGDRLREEISELEVSNLERVKLLKDENHIIKKELMLTEQKLKLVHRKKVEMKRNVEKKAWQRPVMLRNYKHQSSEPSIISTFSMEKGRKRFGKRMESSQYNILGGESGQISRVKYQSEKEESSDEDQFGSARRLIFRLNSGRREHCKSGLEMDIHQDYLKSSTNFSKNTSQVESTPVKRKFSSGVNGLTRGSKAELTAEYYHGDADDENF